jgi:hypothetical protein
VDDQAAALRRMLLAMVNDLRVVLLRLASRLQTLRYYAATKTGGSEPFARETMALYAPLANRLGIWQLKWELEDLAFRFLEPETYNRLPPVDESRSSVNSSLPKPGQVARCRPSGIKGGGGGPAHLRISKMHEGSRSTAVRCARSARDRRRGRAVLPGAVAARA